MTKNSQQESRYARSLIEASLDPLVTISAEGKILDVNEASIKVTGVPREKLIGTDFSNYFTEPQKAQQGYLQVFEKGFVSDYPLTIKHKNGTLTDVSYNASVYKDEKGNVLGVFAAARDVTEQKWAIDLKIANKELAFQNNEKEKRAAELVFADKELTFQIQEKIKQETANIELEAISNSLKLASQYSRSLIEASLDPLFTINPEGKITDMNIASLKITERTRENLIGTDFFEYFTEPDKAREIYKRVFAEGFVADFPLTICDGKLTDVLFNGSVYKDEDGKVLGVVVVARDVTDHKRIETELTEAKVFAELASIIAEEAKCKAEEAAHIAEEAVRSKQQFLSNMSHEIRTPMNAIIGFTKVLLKTDLSEKQKEYLSAIKMSGDALIVLINDILDLAKVDAGKMMFDKTPFKLSVSLAAMIHLFEAKIQEKNLLLIREYDENIPKVMIGDPIRLHQIILNLIDNAVKFTNQGNISVSARIVYENDEIATIEFAVEDTGIGIDASRIEHIFENFQQATSDTAKIYGGTGLGLAISKQLVESQGGSISVVSEPGKGSTFSFILPFLKTDVYVELETELEGLDASFKNLKVLVVEDIPLNQLLMKTLLDEFGFENFVAENGRIAIEKLLENQYDIILMDLQMPEMNGFEAAEYIRNTMKSSIPIIALTADVTTADLQKCRAVGMNDYIAKPVDERLLYYKMVDLLRNPDVLKEPEEKKIEDNESSHSAKGQSCIDLAFLEKHTKKKPALMMEMISLFLEQTPHLLSTMKQSANDKDWDLLYQSVHKLIPSFAIMGISGKYEAIAKKIQESAGRKENHDDIHDWVMQIDSVCAQACEELKEEYKLIKETK
ncbi:MAG: PAS domain S-box protein [Bacteroidetes bacterium]|nr:PAS domain S-box protein [Bacteroidota bacterium]